MTLTILQANIERALTDFLALAGQDNQREVVGAVLGLATAYMLLKQVSSCQVQLLTADTLHPPPDAAGQEPAEEGGQEQLELRGRRAAGAVLAAAGRHLHPGRQVRHGQRAAQEGPQP